MIEFWISALACIAFGIMATLHPCPFSVVVSSISLLAGIPGSAIKKRSYLLLFCFAYISVIFGVGAAAGMGIFSISAMSLYLQLIFPAFLGPVFILSGMVLNGLLDLGRYKNILLLKLPKSGVGNQYSSALYIGGLVGLSFCPATAALYFGAMLPLALRHNQVFMFPALYGIGAVLPILILSATFHKVQYKFQNRNWLKSIPLLAGWILILAGIYMSLQHIF
jgi:cytochrome c biogenesis protein CcdA